MQAGDWEPVKQRTAADGTVWRSPDRSLFKRIGGPDVLAEAEMQRALAENGYPVPEIVDSGGGGDACFFVEKSLGDQSLHDISLREAGEFERVRSETLEAAAGISRRLLVAQVRAAHRPSTDGTDWAERAGFVGNVLTENPDLNTARVRNALNMVVACLREIPVAQSHLDYGLPNAFRGGVIDWQHYAPAPVGFDVYPMLDITAFKGGGKGYAFTPRQRSDYIASLDEVSVDLLGLPLSQFLGDFLLVKCFFFLAMMKPTDQGNQRKALKWAYRKALFAQGLKAYEHDHTIDTGTFPTLALFTFDRNEKV